MRKKKIALLFWFIVLAIAIGTAAQLLDGVEKKIYSRVEVDEYGFSISYPNYYEEIITETTAKEQISETITSTLTESIDKNDISIKLVEKVIYEKSSDSGLTLLVEAIKKEKTPKTIEEICKDYMTMFKIFNESLTVIESSYEEIEIDGIPAGKTRIYASKNGGIDNLAGMVSFLIPMEDREITISFTGTQKMLVNAEKEINKIIKSVKFYELPVSESVVEE